MKTKFIRISVYILISVGIVVTFLYYLFVNAEKYQELLKISPFGVILLLFLSLLFPIVNGIQNTLLYRSLGILDFSHMDGFLITSASSLANQLPIPGGILSKGYYLKRKHNLSYSRFSSSFIATFFCFLAVNGFVGIAVLITEKFRTGGSIPLILLIPFLLMLAPVSIFRFPLEKLKIPDKIQHLTHQAIDGWSSISKNPGLIIQLIVTQTMLVVFLSFRYLIAFHMLSQNVSLNQTLLFASASILTQLVSIAPGGLGVREAIVATLATVLGFDAGVSVVAVSLDRLISTSIIILTGWLSTFILGKQIIAFS